jgi:putative ABC transport system permease protein
MGQRSRESRIRIAVGATRGNVMAVVLHQGLVLTLIATSIGEGAALPAARALTQLLFGISPLDATSFCPSVVLLGFLSVAACVIPALRSVAP